MFKFFEKLLKIDSKKDNKLDFNLPDEILLEIFKQIPKTDLGKVAQVNCQFWRVAQTDTLQLQATKSNYIESCLNGNGYRIGNLRLTMNNKVFANTYYMHLFGDKVNIPAEIHPKQFTVLVNALKESLGAFMKTLLFISEGMDYTWEGISLYGDDRIHIPLKEYDRIDLQNIRNKLKIEIKAKETPQATPARKNALS